MLKHPGRVQKDKYLVIYCLSTISDNIEQWVYCGIASETSVCKLQTACIGKYKRKDIHGMVRAAAYVIYSS